MVYLACASVDAIPPRVVSRGGLVEVCWLDLDQAVQRMPDLYQPVRSCLADRLR